MNSDLDEFSVGVHGLLSRQLSQAPAGEEAIDALERNIEQSMANVFRSFRKAKNDETRVNSLPREILVTFLSAVEPNAIEALKLSHVCQHWREVVLAEPALWSRIELAGNTQCSRTVLGALLERTSPATPLELSLSVSAGHSDVQALGQLVSDHLPHLASLSLTGDSASLGTIQAALVLPAPSLRVLEMTDIDERYVAIVHMEIFARKVPQLHRLVLSNVVPRIWTHFLFAAPKLQDLTLAGSMLSPSTFDLAHCLSTAPELRRLCLEDCGIRPFPPHPGDEALWDAKHLESLKMTGQDEHTVTFILQHLPFKALTSIEVSPASLSSMVQLLKSLPTPLVSLALESPVALQSISIRAAGAAAENGEPAVREGEVRSTNGVPCILLFQQLVPSLTSALTHMCISYELWPHVLLLALPTLQTLIIGYIAVPPPAYQLSLFLNTVLRVPVATLAYLLQSAVRTNTGKMKELVLVNMYAEEEPGSGDVLLSLCTVAPRISFVPVLPARLQV
ncbi:hypothetical protein BKA62DRAFT_716021 [Auriculariales sp. MPI-PUGE-AT-0066]|nr:hypothetical protein BKA62DRAFT_716021 [Auriculariales sp. MPI-PUGE-AT-0066]